MRSSKRWRQTRYVAVGALGTLQLQQECNPLLNSAISYAYDALGRLASRTVAAPRRRGRLGRPAS